MIQSPNGLSEYLHRYSEFFNPIKDLSIQLHKVDKDMIKAENMLIRKRNLFTSLNNSSKKEKHSLYDLKQMKAHEDQEIDRLKKLLYNNRRHSSNL